MLTIESLTCWLVDIPTVRPHKLSMATMGCQTLTLVRMQCAEGVVGWGEATTIGGLSYGAESPEAIRSAMETYLAPLLCGQRFSGVASLAEKMNASVKGNTFAKSALETAFLDAQGKLLGLPVSALLGGALCERLPVLWTLASGDTGKDIEEGKRLLAEGRHDTFKLKIGARSLKTDIAHALAIKAALGDAVSVRVDVNQAWDFTTAVNGMRQLQDGGIDLVEQPIPLWDRAGLIALSQRFTLPVLADEAVATGHDGYALASGGFTGAYALKIAKAGGPAQALKLAHIAQAAGVALYGGTMLEGTLGTVASLHAWSTVNLQWGTEMFGPLLLKDDVVTQPLSFSDGQVTLPQGPGLGVEIDEEKLRYYARH
ncbi:MULTISPECIES: muconate/chloromuconate family cycloisomerase [Enterobacteriaceae]|uniref:Muconate cycloisomerase n=1 Tax=Kluyvera genomosp. 2 TaxID=2774054 RepID=A0A2T2XWY3_9ENTR|nr:MULTISPECIES: muconate/chloromuconate family cycloisomerase [Enterobacteriaceae]HAT3920636.1 muconate cycloisomerase [Kluyvera ascorbata]PSR44757.1 muconate cycloisomerase [Kluyvera genomosp. 2]BBQ83550.1 muconate cycloisomerase [Klebsiella sp. WP3-W18-ESBL-02]BBR20573.1 muconate cycloisomerase [Klebsiella sp. WP3-S18-ESBL-05]BBR59223.1 muconate cycloisomerase [Klebsiella sp. WP4-W18-ESBL-05]